ncbi:unnamed protein product [Acanthoscelides obtectus]|uniref:Uncharacterized protein n=1 Tax=Acanthoscelides obtectus TaxID=200917 RepID=A0A9P0JRW8_ACAOB|nr:unnamed protein product [Acanthoscelides obtectus]CAK1668027.1 hypothetical protein AOBTE_LOCUS26185 [Acanthoscelides obtectus]
MNNLGLESTLDPSRISATPVSTTHNLPQESARTLNGDTILSGGTMPDSSVCQLTVSSIHSHLLQKFYKQEPSDDPMNRNLEDLYKDCELLKLELLHIQSSDYGR